MFTSVNFVSYNECRTTYGAQFVMVKYCSWRAQNTWLPGPASEY